MTPHFAHIVISNSQRRFKDCYVPLPILDLTLRCNGEERVSVMDSLGNFHRCGFDAPTAAPSISTPGTAGTFTANKYWQYRYAAVSKVLFPKVENAATGNGSPAPRSNPSPSVAADSTVNTNLKRLSIPTSQVDEISHFWIYRTNYFDTAAQAASLSASGNLFWIGEVANDPNVASVLFDDDGTQAGLEQIENDNFVCPQFQFAVYADPFIYGFGNNEIDVEVAILANGRIEIQGANERWYNGRDGQIVRMEGVTVGGFDRKGSFYFKQLTSTTAQLYNDIFLTNPSTISYTGTTRATIKGLSTTLFRSKERNPFSWGVTDVIEDTLVPRPYFLTVGGGRGTAIGVIPGVNLLKLDVEAPNRSYTLNLRNAGTPNFESSLRSFPDNYCVSVHHSQFPATIERDDNVLWGLDTKTKTILQCDGTSQKPVSDPIFRSLKDISTESADRLFFHGGYVPRMELNCMFVRTTGSPFQINKLFFMHGPTRIWGSMDVLDILCSASILDPTTNESKLFVGTETGLIGEIFAKDKIVNWYEEDPFAQPDDIARGVSTFPSVADSLRVDLPSVVGITGNWFTVNIGNNQIVYARVSDWDPVAGTEYIVHFDRVVNAAGQTLVIPATVALDPGHPYWIGLIECEVGKIFNAQVPFDWKKLQGIFTSWRQLNPASFDSGIVVATEAPRIEFRGWDPIPLNAVPTEYVMKERANIDDAPSGSGTVFQGNYVYSLEDIPFDIIKSFGIVVKDRSYSRAQLVSLELRARQAN